MERSHIRRSLTPAERQAAGEFRRGAIAYNRGDDAAAEAAFSRGLAIDPTSAPALLYRGLARLRLEKESAALEDLAMALVRDPTCVEAAWARARVLAVRQQWAEAARDFGRVIALKPDDATAVACRGEARFHLADWPGCLADYRRALALAPTDYKHLNRLAWVLATCPEAQFRNPAESVALAQTANQIAGGLDPLVVDTLEVALRAARDASRDNP